MQSTIIEQIQNEFYIFNSDEDFYKTNYITEISYKSYRRKILKIIQTAWKNNDIDWFITYLDTTLTNEENFNIDTLKQISDFLENWGLELNINVLEYTLEESSSLATLLEKILCSNYEVTEDYIESLSDDENIIKIIKNYAIIVEKLPNSKQIPRSYYGDDYIWYCNTIKNISILSISELDEKLQELDRIKKSGHKDEYEKLRNEITLGLLRYIIKKVKNFNGLGLDYMDVIQSGNEGLLNSFLKYNISDGVFFSYAAFYIKGYVFKYLNNSRNIVLPSGKFERYNKLSTAMYRLKKELDREPTTKELASFLNISSKDLENELKQLNDAFSIEAYLADEDEQLVYSMREDNMEDYYIEEILKDYIKKLLALLTEKEERIIRMYFGVQDKNNFNSVFATPHTLQEIANTYDVSRQSIYRYINDILKKLNTLLNMMYLNNEIEEGIAIPCIIMENQRLMIKSVPPKERKLMELYDMRVFTIKEIAEKLGLNRKEVEERIKINMKKREEYIFQKGEAKHKLNLQRCRIKIN